jgi:uncharacterized protein
MNLKPLVQTLLEEYALPRAGTYGVGHWARVLQNGLRLSNSRSTHAKASGSLARVTKSWISMTC